MTAIIIITIIAIIIIAAVRCIDRVFGNTYYSERHNHPRRK